MKLGKSSLQKELDEFFREVKRSDFSIREVTKGAFTLARAKLDPNAFVEMNASVNGTFYSEAPYLTWHQMRLLAGDGSTAVLPTHETVRKEFAEKGFGPNADSFRSVARLSFLFDVLNLTTLDAQIAPYSTGEREMMRWHLENLRKGDCILLDMGYQGVALFLQIMARGAHFCTRMNSEWLIVRRFLASGERECIVSLPKLSKADRHLFKDHPEMLDREIKCRLVCIELETGEKEVLCTSLTDMEEFKYEEFCELYHMRWGVEESYKLFKERMKLEDFSGKTALAVKQDFHAKVFMMSLCAILAFPIAEKVKKEFETAKWEHPHQINKTFALQTMSMIRIGLFIRKSVGPALEAFDNLVRRTKEIVRPGRHFAHKHRKKVPPAMNHKHM